MPLQGDPVRHSDGILLPKWFAVDAGKPRLRPEATSYSFRSHTLPCAYDPGPWRSYKRKRTVIILWAQKNTPLPWCSSGACWTAWIETGQGCLKPNQRRIWDRLPRRLPNEEEFEDLVFANISSESTKSNTLCGQERAIDRQAESGKPVALMPEARPCQSPQLRI